MIRWIAKDFGIKTISFFLAVGLWYYAVGEESVGIKRSIPLELEMKNTQMSILKASARNIQVTLVGPRAMLSEMTSAEIKAVHKIGSELKTAGDYTFRLESQEIRVPNPQIRIEAIEPAYIVVSVDEVIVKKLGIEPNFVGDPAFGYTVSKEEMQLDPSAILVEGPKGELEKMDILKTERIDLVGRIRSFRRTAKLDLPQNIKPMSEALIDVFVPIKEEFVEKSFEKVPVRVVRSADASSDRKVEVEPGEVVLALKGSKNDLEKISAENLFAYVDTANLLPGENQVSLSVILPKEVQLKDDAPKIKVVLKGK